MRQSIRRVQRTPLILPINICPQQVANLVIDIQERTREVLTYRHGTVDDGLARVLEMIRLARNAGSLIVLVKFNPSVNGDILPEIKDAAGSDALIISKIWWSSFKDTDLDEILNGRRIKVLVLNGFNRSGCILSTGEHGIKRGYEIATSDQIMFGHRKFDRRKEITAAMEFYKHRGHLYEKIGDLATAVGWQ